MNKSKQPIQFKSFKEIDRFITKKDSGILDNIFEDIYDEYDPDEEEREFVREFNKAIKHLFKLVS
jgi:hypothetical protein